MMSTKTGTPSHPNSSSPSYLLPIEAIDTHVHVFDPKLGPYAAGRAYTPEDAPLKELIRFNKGLSREGKNTKLVLVQPSPYKNDCSVLMQCLQTLANEGVTAFGIAVLDLDQTTDVELKNMHALGVRGIRLNFQADSHDVSADKLIAALHRTANRIRYLPGWVIQLFVPGWVWDVLHDAILELPVKVIADHLGGMRGPSKLPHDLHSAPTSQPGFRSLVSLAASSHVFVKISGLYRMSSETSSTYNDLQEIITLLAQEAPDSLIWGSDWPHTGDGQNRSNGSLNLKERFRTIDNRSVIDHVQQWVGMDVYQKMMVDNPARIYFK